MNNTQYSDEELVNGLLANNEKIIKYFFFEKCTPMFCYIIKNIFDYKADKEELISELFIYIQENNWYKLRLFDYRSRLTTWLSVVAIRFFYKKRDELIENSSQNPLIIQETSHDPFARLMAKMDVVTLLQQMPNDRYRQVLQALFIDDVELEQLALQMGITIDNLYNIKRRALAQLIEIVKRNKL